MAEWGHRQSSLRKFGEEHLQCPICHDWYKDPKTLSCLHSFCAKCLEGCTKRGYDFSYDYINKVACPFCRKVTDLRKKNVWSLPTDFKLAGMVEAVTKEPVEEEPTCIEHLGKICCGYCYTCNRVICFLCLQYSHNTHKIGEVGEVAKDLKQLVRKQTISNEKSLDNIDQALEAVSELTEDCRALVEAIRKNVEDRADQEIARITAAKQRIMDKLDAIQNDREMLLAESTQEFESTKECLRTLIKDSEAAVKIKNDYDFLKSYTELKDSLFDDQPSCDIEHIDPFSVEFRPSLTPSENFDLGMLYGNFVISSYDEDDEEDDEEDKTCFEDMYSNEIYSNAKKWRGNWLCSEAEFPHLGCG